MIVSVEEVKNFLSGIKTDATDSAIAALITQNQVKAESYVGYSFEFADNTDIVKLDNTNILKLQTLPVNEITAFKDLDDNELNITVKDFCKSTQKSGVFTLSETVNQSIKIEYTSGYGINFAVPEDIKQAVIKLVSADLLQGKVFNSLDEAESNAYTPASFRKSAYDILDEYKIWSV